MRLREFARCEVSDATKLPRHTALMRPKIDDGAYHAVHAAEELARLHRKYSPVAHLFAEEESG